MAMKFRAHETFFIRKGWLSKGMKAVKNEPTAFISKEKNPMDTLGIGSNMVKSLRYWLQAVGITEEPNSGKRVQTFTPLGEKIYEHDRYIEELGTLYLLQYRLASQEELVASWYYFYNVFNMTEFNRDDFVAGLNGYVIDANGESAAMRSLTDDFNCIIGTYVPRYKTDPGKVSPENNIDCPFGELGLVDIVDKNRKIYRKVSPSAESIDPWVILAVLMDQAKGATEVGLKRLVEDKYVVYLKRSNNYLRLKETSGVDVRTEIINMIGKRVPKLDIKNVLNESNFDHYLYPSRYNDEKEMTRYFDFRFIDVSEVRDDTNWVLKREDINADGVIFAVVPNAETNIANLKETLKKASESCLDCVFVLPDKYTDIRDSVAEFDAVEALMQTVSDDQILFEDYEVVYEDIS